MKISKKIAVKLKKLSLSLSGVLLSSAVFAQDKLSGVMGGDIQDMFSDSGTLWKIFILVDIILAAAALIKTKNPMVFFGVLAIVFIPRFLMNAFVF